MFTMPARLWTPLAASFLVGFPSCGAVDISAASPSEGCERAPGQSDISSLVQRRLTVVGSLGKSLHEAYYSSRCVEDGIVYNGTVDVEELSGDVPRSFVYIHIPKTGGTTLMIKSPDFLPVGSTLQGNFEKAALFNGMNGTDDRAPIAVFRDPVSHVLSQFLQCKHSGRTEGTKFPQRKMRNDTYGGLDTWLHHFAEVDGGDSAIDDFNCYCPWNMQARYMTSEHPSGDAERCFSQADASPDLEEAKRNVDKLFFVGIQELYPESLCALMFYSTGSVPEDCACGDRFGGHSRKMEPRAHGGVPHHSVSDLSASTRASILKLTKIDVELWTYTVQVFLRLVRHAEEESGVGILCGSRADEVTSRVRELLDSAGADVDLESN